jgi:alkylation response protein AidB-like acyl-CoA dehydrogenase
MELALDEDQELFHETTVRFIESELPVERTRALHDDPVGFDRDWLTAAAELGWFTMLVPEADGGGSVSGDGLIDATLIAEEIGRFVQPGPFIPMNVVAAAIATSGTDIQRAEFLPALMAGETIASWAFADANGNWDLGTGLVATKTSDGFTLAGRRGYVQDAAAADVVLVTATLDGRPGQFLVPTGAAGVSITPLACLDLSRRLAHVDFDQVAVDACAQLGDGDATDALERQLQIALALVVAETVGAMDALFSMTVEYSKDRIAFGRPIGSFQALKHIMADDAMTLETCKAGATAAARVVQDHAEDAAEIVSMVAAYVGDMSDQLAQDCLQIHGGIGFTWEHDLHLLMRRIRTNAVIYGEPAWLRKRVCAFHGLGVPQVEGSAS